MKPILLVPNAETVQKNVNKTNSTRALRPSLPVSKTPGELFFLFFCTVTAFCNFGIYVICCIGSVTTFWMVFLKMCRISSWVALTLGPRVFQDWFYWFHLYSCSIWCYLDWVSSQSPTLLGNWFYLFFWTVSAFGTTRIGFIGFGGQFHSLAMYDVKTLYPGRVLTSLKPRRLL